MNQVMSLCLLIMIIGSCTTQLITPFQICEMKCIQDHGGPLESPEREEVYKTCRINCSKTNLFEHNFGNQGTLG
ncbi:hypothetical protein SNE40_023077 [Patella caerulea]|uniref:Uncharacterized protein n=1 Tax=Patella caerulea TaxID=87958 RepID=A0AAN8G5J8_PATCE